MSEPGSRRRRGRVELAVRRDLRRLGRLDTGVRGSLAEVAYKLARAIDDADEEPASTVAKLAQELRVTLGALREVGGGDDGDEGAVADDLSTAVRDAPQPGAGDVGPEGGDGGGVAGEAADAAPAAHPGRGV